MQQKYTKDDNAKKKKKILRRNSMTQMLQKPTNLRIK